jgi:branched-chain amino acid transport system ATP-binding protein
LALQTKDVTIRFGGVLAVNSLSLTIHAGEIVGLIGPNGAGKTTFVNCISGACSPESGDARWQNENILGLPPSALIQKGISRTFQNVAALHELTVLDIVKLGYGVRKGQPLRDRLSDRLRGMDALGEHLVDAIMTPLGVADFRDAPVQSLPYGHRKAVDLARALASGPQLLLLDEPVAGLSTAEATSLAKVIRNVRDSMGCTVLMIEHKMDVVNSTCDRVIVMAAGSKVFEGGPAEVQANADVRRVYLGEP